MQLEDIKKLAEMARIEIDEKEMKEIGDSFGPILDYVGQIQEVSATVVDTKEPNPLIPFNVMREDIATNENGQFTEKILKQFPDSENGFLKVKRIL